MPRGSRGWGGGSLVTPRHRCEEAAAVRQADPAELELREKTERVPSLSKFGKQHRQSRVPGISVLHRELGLGQLCGLLAM